MKGTIGIRPSLPYGAGLVERKGVRWYQADGRLWLAYPRNRILADPMRAGKTMQWLLSLPRRARGIVVCPAIAKGVWADECRFWRDDLIPTVGDRIRRPREGEIVIVSYDSLPEPTRGWTRRLIPEELGDVYGALDEAQLAKSSEADRTVACRLLVWQLLRANGLTGTPAPGGVKDLWGILETCRANWPWASKKAFFEDSEREDFSERLRLVVLRRDLDVIAPSLPPITIQAVPVPTPERLMAELGMLYAAWSVEEGKLPAVGHGSHVLRLLAESRIEDAIQLARSVLASGKPVLVFSCFREPVMAMGRIPRSACMTGDTPDEERASMIRRFQSGALDLLACTVDTGGVAVKLSRAQVVIETDQDWTPNVNDQAIARAVDLQKAAPIHVYRMMGTHPLERRVADVRKRKEKTNARILQGLR